MSGDVNRFGLKRRIPPDVARAVRKRCGFGCVVCGSALYDYDHFSPEFKDAPGHDPLGVILLCPNHHRAKGGFVSRATLERCANAPFCKAQGFSHTAMDIGNLTISIGPYVAYRCRTALEVNSMFGVDRIGFRGAVLGWLPIVEMPMRAKAIWFEPSEEDGAPLQLNAIICGRDGKPLAWIENNVWHGSASNLDIQVVAGNERSKVRVQAHDDGLVPRCGVCSTQPRHDLQGHYLLLEAANRNMRERRRRLHKNK